MEHKELKVWRESIELVVDIYDLTKNFPKEEIYSLTSQLKRAAVSIPSNISEGAARNSDKEFIKYLYISLGSLAELDTQLIISQRLGYIKDVNNISERVINTRKMLLGLIKYLKKKQIK